VQSYSNELGSVQKLLEAGDGAGLEELFAAARDARNRWLQSS
jgi:prephenate dehydrogenase